MNKHTVLLMEKVARFDDVSDLCKQILLDFPDDPIALGLFNFFFSISKKVQLTEFLKFFWTVKMAVSVGTKGNVEEAIKLLKRATGWFSVFLFFLVFFQNYSTIII